MEYGYRSSIKQVEERGKGLYMEYGYRSSIKKQKKEEKVYNGYMDIGVA